MIEIYDIEAFKKALVEKPTPCEKFSCKLQPYCGAHRQACKVFHDFISKGKLNPPDLKQFPPSRKRYDQIFSGKK